MKTDLDYKFSFPAIRGIQAKREYYLIMCPLRLITKLFSFDEEGEIPPEMRAQRILNRSRVPEIIRYIVENTNSYIFSAITVSIDGNVYFESISDKGHSRNIGTLIVPMDVKFIINDGQHRWAALKEALKQQPKLADETIAVVLFVDTGLKRSQQMFADLNKHAIRPTKSIGILYDHRDPLANLVRNLIDRVGVFKDRTDLEKTSISNRSTKLFTLSNIYQATQALLRKSRKDPVFPLEEELAVEFWNEVADNIPEWGLACEEKVPPARLREDFIHSHGVALKALGIAGADLIKQHPEAWKDKLKQLEKVDWSRSNTKLWEGRAMNGGKIRRSQDNITLTVNTLKKQLGIALSEEEQETEERFLQRRRP